MINHARNSFYSHFHQKESANNLKIEVRKLTAFQYCSYSYLESKSPTVRLNTSFKSKNKKLEGNSNLQYEFMRVDELNGI